MFGNVLHELDMHPAHDFVNSVNSVDEANVADDASHVIGGVEIEGGRCVLVFNLRLGKNIIIKFYTCNYTFLMRFSNLKISYQ